LATVDNPPVRRVASVIALWAALAVVAAGCGGAPPEEKWASGVCSDISDWKDQLQKSVNDVREQVQSPGTGTVAAIQAEVQEALDATQELASDLKARGAPDVESGDQAKQQLDALATQLDATVTQAKQTIENLPAGADAGEIVKRLAPLAPAIQSLVVKTSSTLDSVKTSGSKIKEGFDKADSCDEFR
jgi:uncharacterized phage infection (PIP) family protein YhgE